MNRMISLHAFVGRSSFKTVTFGLSAVHCLNLFQPFDADSMVVPLMLIAWLSEVVTCKAIRCEKPDSDSTGWYRNESNEGKTGDDGWR